MRKRLLFIVMAGVLMMAGCSESDDEIETVGYEEESEVLNLDEVEDYEYLAERVNFSKSHINIELREGLNVDADITVDVPVEMGMYAYEEVLWDETIDYNQWVEDFKACVNEYYGEDIAVSQLEAYENPDPTKLMVGYLAFDKGSFRNYYCYDDWYDKYSYIESTYNKEVMDGVIKEFVDHFREFLPEDIDYSYACVHFDDEYWKKFQEISGISRSNFEYGDLDFYMVRLFSEVEAGTTIDSMAYMDMVFNEGKELMAICMRKQIAIGECIAKNPVLDAKEILGEFYDRYAKNPLWYGVIVRDISLKYEVCTQDEVDENGKSIKYLEPVWEIKYTDNGPAKCFVERYSAFTGELIEKLN